MKFCRSAFTLIELALVLVIVSLMTGFGMQAVESTTVVNCYETTEAQLATIDSALKRYAANNQRFPKPAYMTLGSNDADFGKEATNGIAVPPTSAAYGSATPSGMSSNGGVLFGALPHATLGLSAQYAADCWGNKFTYAVVNSQTSSDTTSGYTSTQQGNIALRSGTSASPVVLADNAVYVVLSHGQDKFGATALTATNTTEKNCNGSSAANIDKENCNNTDIVFFNSVRSTGDTNRHFDDLLVYSQKTKSVESCPSQTVKWGPGDNCYASSSPLNNGDNQTLNSSGTYYSGSIGVTCQDGALTLTAGTCAAIPGCDANKTVTWTAGGYTCSALSGSAMTHRTTKNINNTQVYRTGSTDISCDGSVPPPPATGGTITTKNGVCNPTPCPPGGSVSWGPGNACTASFGGSMNVGDTASAANTTPWYSGNVTASCRNDNDSNPSYLEVVTGDCTATPPLPCDGKTVNWGAGCSATIPSLAHEDTNSFANTAANFTGNASVRCYNGTATVQSGTCDANCPATTHSWGAGCSANFPAIAGNGATSTQNNSAGGYTGSATYRCTNGSPSYQGGVCDLIVNGSCGTADGASTLSAPSTNLCAQGTASAVSGSGPWTWNCTGSGGGSNASCSSNRSCSGSSSWGGSCAGNYGTLSHGSSTALSNANAGYDGYTTVTCNQGTANLSGSSCTPSSPAGCYNNFEVYATYYYGNAAETINITCNAGQGADSEWYTDNNNPWRGGAWWMSNQCHACSTPCTPAADGQPPANPCGCQNADTDGNGSCGFQCRADGQSSSGNAALCCNGDSDNNGTCGTQSGCTPAAEAAFEAACATYSSSGITDSSYQNWEDCQPCGSGYVATCHSNQYHTEYGTWEDSYDVWSSLSWSGSGSATGSDQCNHYYASSTYPGGPHDDWSGTCPYTGPYCTASQPGSCGTANGQNYNTAPSGGSLCSVGTASAVSGTGPWTWTCTGGSGTASCTAYRLCNSATVSWGAGCSVSMPSTNYNVGATKSNTASGYTGSAYVNCGASGSWTTSSTSCSASATPIDGQCGNSCGSSCAAGTYGGDTGNSNCYGGQIASTFWCRGINGGADAECAPNCCGSCNSCT